MALALGFEMEIPCLRSRRCFVWLSIWVLVWEWIWVLLVVWFGDFRRRFRRHQGLSEVRFCRIFKGYLSSGEIEALVWKIEGVGYRLEIVSLQLCRSLEGKESGIQIRLNEVTIITRGFVGLGIIGKSFTIGRLSWKDLFDLICWIRISSVSKNGRSRMKVKSSSMFLSSFLMVVNYEDSILLWFKGGVTIWELLAWICGIFF